MEDLWKDINLSSLHHPSLATPTTTISTPQLHRPQPHNHLHIQPSITNNIFQDFLARPLSLNPINTHTRTQTNPMITSISNNAPPQTILSLNNNDHPPDFHLGDSSSGHSPPYNPFDYTSSSVNPHHTGHLQETECDEMNNLNYSQHPFDRRHKRMIKNRESAARSRARKQAYTTELEQQVAQLRRENAGLRMEQEVHMRNQAAAAMDQTPKKHKLHRTSTAPF